MIKACIFDLDGTTVYTLEAIAKAGNRMLEELGFSPQPAEDYRYYCGDGADKLVERVLEKTGGMNHSNYESGCFLNRKFLSENPLYGAKAYTGLPEVLSSLKERGIRLAVFSNKPDTAAQDTITGIYGKDFFSAVRGQNSLCPKKPAPDGALEIAGKFGVLREECLYFGDTGTDMLTAGNAGMTAVGVLWGYRDEDELLKNGADYIVHKPEDILLLPALKERK